VQFDESALAVTRSTEFLRRTIDIMKRRTVLKFASVFALSALCARSNAQSYPSRPIRFVVPYGAGGGPDVIARLVGRKLGENMGQPVVVDNRPGGAGIIATEHVARSPADGYTILVGDTGPLCINPNLFAKLPYDPVKDFAPVTLSNTAPLFMVVNANQPIQSVAQLIEYARARPGLPFGSTGNGSMHHLGMELFKLMTKVDMTHIPYKGVAQSVPAVLAGDIAVVFAALPSVLPHVKSGKVRLIGVATGTRTKFMPEVPSIAETLPGYSLTLDSGFLAPAGTPNEIVEKLHDEIVKVLGAPDIVQQLMNLGLIPIGSSPQQYAETIRTDLSKFAKLVKESGARVD